MIKAFIFDLDNCIFDTFSLGDTRLRPLWEKVDDLALSGLIETSDVPRIKDDLCRLTVFDTVNKNKLSVECLEILRASMVNIRVQGKVETYGDHEVIKNIRGRKFLVTGGAGHEEYQHSKIKALGVEYYFDSIVMAEAGKKKYVFENLLAQAGFSPKEFLVLGDNPHSELAAGKELGMVTVQTLRPHIERAEGFDHYIKSFHELPKIIARYG